MPKIIKAEISMDGRTVAISLDNGEVYFFEASEVKDLAGLAPYTGVLLAMMYRKEME